MGVIWSRFRGKQTTYEILEGIEKDITKLQKNRKDNQDRQSSIVFRLIIYSVILYIIAAVVFIFVYLPDTWNLRILYSTPLLVFPFIIWGLKRLLHWYYVKRIYQNDVALRELRERKKQILEDVMETETYNTAKKILERFDPARFKKLEVTESGPSGEGTPGTALHHRTLTRPAGPTGLAPRPTTPGPRAPFRAPAPVTPATVRPVQTQQQLRGPPPPRPTGQSVRQPTPPSTPRHMAPAGRGTPQQQTMSMSTPQTAGRGMVMPARFVPPPGPPMPRSVLPRDRGTMDRLMDYIVGDGPENRYALVCQQCHSHNGMALKEEFEYLSFRCCYCYYLNPARKQRPFAPRMEFFNPMASRQSSSQGSGSKGSTPPRNVESESEEETDEEDMSSEEEEGARPDKQKTSPATPAQAPAGVPVPKSAIPVTSNRPQPGHAPTSSASGASNIEAPGKVPQQPVAPAPGKRQKSAERSRIPQHQPAPTCHEVEAKGGQTATESSTAEVPRPTPQDEDIPFADGEVATTLEGVENSLDSCSDALPPPVDEVEEPGSEESFEELVVTAEDFPQSEGRETPPLATSSS